MNFKLEKTGFIKFITVWMILISFFSCTTAPFTYNKKTESQYSYRILIKPRTDRKFYIDSDFLGFCIDSSQVFGGKWWENSSGLHNGVGNSDTEELNLDNPGLIYLTTALGGGLLRIGGSEADKIYYDIGRIEKGIPEGYDLRMTGEKWDEIIKFCRKTNTRLIFTINAGPGPRLAFDPKAHPVNDRSWDSANAEQLINFAAERGDPVAGWEFGNEINGYPVIHGSVWALNGEELSRDFRLFSELVSSIDSSYLVLGPSFAFWPVIGEPFSVSEDFLRKLSGKIDALPFHYYPQQSVRGGIFRTRPAEIKTLLNEENLNDIQNTINYYRRTLIGNRLRIPLWLGETGNAQFGGQQGISDTFISSLWWIDLLSLAANSGIQHVLRQTLTGSDYGLIDFRTGEPRPDYWTSYLWKHTIHGVPVDAIAIPLTRDIPGSESDGFRLWAFQSESEILLIAVNLNSDTVLQLRTGGVNGMKEIIRVESSPEDLYHCKWNGAAPEISDQNQKKALPWEPVENDLISLSPISYAIVRIVY